MTHRLQELQVAHELRTCNAAEGEAASRLREAAARRDAQEHAYVGMMQDAPVSADQIRLSGQLLAIDEQYLKEANQCLITARERVKEAVQTRIVKERQGEQVRRSLTSSLRHWRQAVDQKSIDEVAMLSRLCGEEAL
ncbi:hypothetical protein [Novosphingobium beihaiensis]|uniref:Flagellar FliJ protein n=1 Tax=Novosphingobium beihaiensis TaxID=2930389 RepID=A0ABT0BPN3_9SPHN|nr:hypothetical protein [Novosphingobium beihaiensis]MCJ2186987.1 hypothetical protein [Novosphingobium beihaiensis]